MTEHELANRRALWRKQLDFILENGNDELTEWEGDFIDSLSLRYSDRDMDLSFKQSSVLRRIYKKVEERVG